MAKQNPLESQRKLLEQLMQNPEKYSKVDVKPATQEKKLREPPELVRNVLGSSAAAGSGDFHVYKNARRREMERNRILDEAIEREQKALEFEKKRKEVENMDKMRTEKKKLRRQKRKLAKGQKSRGNKSSEVSERSSEVSKSTAESTAESIEEPALNPTLKPTAESTTETPGEEGNLAGKVPNNILIIDEDPLI